MDPSHFHSPSCGCDPAEDQRFRQMNTDRVKRDPKAAIQALSDGRPPMGLLTAVANLALHDPRIRRLGATPIFIRYVVDGYVNPALPHPDPSVTPPRHWETPLIGIINTLAAISWEDGALVPQDREIRAELQRAYPAIISVVWRDLSHLLPPGPSADFRRTLVANMMGNFWGIEGIRREMYDETSLALAMHCWLYMSIDRKQRQKAVQLITALFGGSEKEYAGPLVKDIAARSVSVDVITANVTAALNNVKLLDEGLEDELVAFNCFAATRRPFSSAFLHAKMYNDVVNALQRQLMTGSPKSTPDALKQGHTLLTNMSACAEDNETMKYFTDMVGNTGMLKVASAGLIIADKIQSDVWRLMLDRIAHTIECTSPTCPFKATPAFRKAALSSFEPVYLSTLYDLRKNAKANGLVTSDAIRLWQRVSMAVGTSEVAVREKWRLDGQCGSVACAKRGSSKRKLKRCTRCRSVLYCGPACQKT